MAHEILALSEECATADQFERRVLAHLERTIGFDAGFFATESASPTVIGLEAAALKRLVARAGIYSQEVLPVKRAALAANGVAVDTEILGARHVSRTRYFREVASTIRGRHSLLACVPLRGRIVTGIMLGRSGSIFSDSELRRVESLLHALGICRASYGLPAPALNPLPSPAEGGLAERLGIGRGHVRDSIETASGRVTIVDRRGYREMIAARDGIEVVWSRASLDDSCRSGWPYIELLHLAAVRARHRRRALFVGCGGAIALRQFARTYPGISLDLVELEPKVVELARAWYDLDAIPNLTVHIGDGAAFVAGTPSRWDIVVLDAYDASLVSTLVADRPLFRAIRGALAPGGAMAVNVIASLDGGGGLARLVGGLRVMVFSRRRGFLPSDRHSLAQAGAKTRSKYALPRYFVPARQLLSCSRMNARTPFLLTICLGLSACGGDARGSSGDPVGAGAQPSPAQQDVPQSQDAAKGSPEPRGVTGAHVWFATSVSVAIRTEWSFVGWGGNAGRSGSSCIKFDRASLSAAQLDALDAITLVPISSACTLDGYSVQQLTVVDADGTWATYRDTGCSYLGVEGASAMLPYDALQGEAFAAGGTPCE